MTKDFVEIFRLLKEKIARFTPPLTILKDDEKEYGVYSVKKIEFAGKFFDQLYFATIIIQKNYVTLHFFPAYTHPEVFENIPAEIKKMHKGKSCFNIKKLDERVLSQFDQLLKDGYELYRKGDMIPAV